MQGLIEEPDDELTENGKELKALAERMVDNEGYVFTEKDKEIYDQRWRKIWKDNKSIDPLLYFPGLTAAQKELKPIKQIAYYKPLNKSVYYYYFTNIFLFYITFLLFPPF